MSLLDALNPNRMCHPAGHPPLHATWTPRPRDHLHDLAAAHIGQSMQQVWPGGGSRSCKGSEGRCIWGADREQEQHVVLLHLVPLPVHIPPQACMPSRGQCVWPLY